VTVTVLTSAHWPTYTYLPATLPPELAAATRAFEAFYAAKYSQNRRLQWQHSIGRCQLRAAFPKGRKELEVSVLQAIVLLLFNAQPGGDAGAGAGGGGGGGGGVPFLRIREASGIEDGELRRTLQSLALGQHRVLRKDRTGKEIEDGDVFRFNEAFEAPLLRVKVNSIQMKETKKEVDDTNERVLQDRQYQVDAAVVRILKSRKQLPKQALLGELFAQLRFPITAEAANKRIASLVERDYLEFGEGAEANVLKYLA
jgi:cullin-4